MRSWTKNQFPLRMWNCSFGTVPLNGFELDKLSSMKASQGMNNDSRERTRQAGRQALPLFIVHSVIWFALPRLLRVLPFLFSLPLNSAWKLMEMDSERNRKGRTVQIEWVGGRKSLLLDERQRQTPKNLRLLPHLIDNSRIHSFSLFNASTYSVNQSQRQSQSPPTRNTFQFLSPCLCVLNSI